MVELYISSPIILHGVELNLLSTRTDIHFIFTLFIYPSAYKLSPPNAVIFGLYGNVSNLNSLDAMFES
jgi:hypothetical protein